MGADWFDTEGYGETVEEAFKKARDRALYDHGHAGYSGTLAEKETFKVTATDVKPDLKAAQEYAWALDRTDDSPVADKWGPAGAVEFTPAPVRQEAGQRAWLFFGWASS